MNFTKISTVAISSFKKMRGNTVAKNIFLVGFLTVVIKFLGFYKETFIAKTFGLSETIDTFLIATLIPAFINNVFVTSFKNIFIPNYVTELNTDKNTSSFQSVGFFITGFICVFFSLIAFFTTDFLLENLFPGHDANYYSLIREQFAYVFPCIFFWGFSSLLGSLLNISNEFTFATLGAIFGPISIICCLLFGQRIFGTNVLAIGTLIGSFISLLYLIILAKAKNVLALSRPDFKGSNVRLMIRQLPAKMTSSLLTGLIEVTDFYFATQLIVGSLAALNYGQKIPAFAIGVLLIALNNVLLPYFSKKVINDKKGAFKTLFKLVRYMFLASSLFALAGIITSTFFIELFFEKNAFTSEDTLIVSAIQRIFLIYVPFRICGSMLVNFITSINKNNFLALMAFLSVILNIVFNIIFMEYYGILGIAISTTLVVSTRSALFYIFALKQNRILQKQL